MCYQWRDNSNMKNFCTLQIVSIDIFVVIDFSSSLFSPRRKVQSHKNWNRSFLDRVAGMFRVLGRLVKMKSSLNVGEKKNSLWSWLCLGCCVYTRHRLTTTRNEKFFQLSFFLSFCLHLNSTQSAIHLASFFSLSCSFTSLSYYQCELQHIFTQHSMDGMLYNFYRKIFLW